ncbi:conjugal transfer protein [Streptomyces sp. ASQP_92]|uniref:conjugal transfer protein n=1 Tax=Streptomyces sp. ASQP_92 TaxID=2979116 RepID=UPI0021BFC8EC|nr:conjugal transfer protein [Streptomyces sp. ASQP_92]MCT9093510.1 conjugal transfer protein [Streptomyces sp. ASQP_92]
MAAGVALARMHRQVRLGRWGVWVALACGPLALAAAALPSPAAPAAAAPAPSSSTVRTPAAANPSGYAELYLAAWLRSASNDETSAQARLAQALAPSVPLPRPEGAQPVLERAVAVRSAQREGGQWSVTVAAQYADFSVRYFAVPIVAGADGGSFAVTGAPGQVAGPTTAKTPESAYGVSLPTKGVLAATVADFLRAYLTGLGQVDRYLAPGVQLAALSGTSYTDLQVDEAAAVEEAASAETVPADGTRVRVRVQITARDKAGAWPLAYELTLTARAGRWEVSTFATASVAGGGGRS